MATAAPATNSKPSAAERLRQAARMGTFASAGAPEEGGSIMDDDFLKGASVAGGATSTAASRPAAAAPRPGVFLDPNGVVGQTPPRAADPETSQETSSAGDPVAQPKLTPSQRLSAASAAHQARDENTRQTRKEMAAMKTLTRLLEAVFTRPGSSASEEERMVALSTLSNRAFELGNVVAKVAGDDADRSRWVRAQAMDAAVTLVCRSWEQNREIDWAKLVTAASAVPEVDQAAAELAQAVYRPVQTEADASDRLGVSLHAAFWQVYTLGETVDGITPKVAAQIVRDCASYLQGREKFVLDNDLLVGWMQGSIRRMTDLVCAETRARFAGAGTKPSPADIESILAISRSGFEGVENYAQSILEKPGHHAVNRPGVH